MSSSWPHRSDRTAVGDGATKGDFIGVFKVTTDRQAIGDARHRNVKVLQQPGQVHGGSFAFDRGAGGQDDLADTFEPCGKPVERQLVGSDAIHGREGAVQHVVQPVILAAALQGQHISGLLDHADEAAVAQGIRADRARLLAGIHDVQADRAGGEAAFRLEDRLGKVTDLVLRLAEQVEGEPLGALGSDAGQPAEFPDEPDQ